MRRPARDAVEARAPHPQARENELEEGGVTETERKELEAEKSTYMEQQRRIETEVNDVTQATRKTWNDVKNGTEKVVNDVGDWIDRKWRTWMRPPKRTRTRTATDHGSGHPPTWEGGWCE